MFASACQPHVPHGSTRQRHISTRGSGAIGSQLAAPLAERPQRIAEAILVDPRNPAARASGGWGALGSEEAVPLRGELVLDVEEVLDHELREAEDAHKVGLCEDARVLGHDVAVRDDVDHALELIDVCVRNLQQICRVCYMRTRGTSTSVQTGSVRSVSLRH